MFLNKRIVKLMALGAAVSITLPVLAQDQQTGAGAAAGQQAREQMFHRLDTNGDGVINFAEFAAMPAPAFDRQDTNGDGNISRDEMLEQRFTRMDSDGNGLLSADELRGAGREGRRAGARVGEGRRGEGDRRQGEMRERVQNMTPEQRAQMRERMQNMTPEQRQTMREQMRQNSQSDSATSGGSGNAAAHDH
ncbi:MAG: EF-hand domain-containing protein [Pseudohongiella sp.]|nr:EF-hand domain-containing protein [Pseudohongiella sp.]MDP2128440.1 EF-hand domain-containing protein [Pseudohongiella sp.]